MAHGCGLDYALRYKLPDVPDLRGVALWVASKQEIVPFRWKRKGVWTVEAGIIQLGHRRDEVLDGSADLVPGFQFERLCPFGVEQALAADVGGPVEDKVVFFACTGNGGFCDGPGIE